MVGFALQSPQCPRFPVRCHKVLVLARLMKPRLLTSDADTHRDLCEVLADCHHAFVWRCYAFTNLPTHVTAEMQPQPPCQLCCAEHIKETCLSPATSCCSFGSYVSLSWFHKGNLVLSLGGYSMRCSTRAGTTPSYHLFPLPRVTKLSSHSPLAPQVVLC